MGSLVIVAQSWPEPPDRGARAPAAALPVVAAANRVQAPSMTSVLRDGTDLSISSQTAAGNLINVRRGLVHSTARRQETPG
jgi:hypothetical protein